MPTLVCGPGRLEVMHAVDEHIVVAELERAVGLYRSILADALDVRTPADAWPRHGPEDRPRPGAQRARRPRRQRGHRRTAGGRGGRAGRGCWRCPSCSPAATTRRRSRPGAPDGPWRRHRRTRRRPPVRRSRRWPPRRRVRDVGAAGRGRHHGRGQDRRRPASDPKATPGRACERCSVQRRPRRRPRRPGARPLRQGPPVGAERAAFAPGAGLVVLEDGGVSVGLGICYDAGSRTDPRLRALGHPRGAVLLGVRRGPTAYRYRVYHPARAVENTVYTLAVNAVGDLAGERYFGRSGAWSPSGHPLVTHGAGDGVRVVDVSPTRSPAYGRSCPTSPTCARTCWRRTAVTAGHPPPLPRRPRCAHRSRRPR
ncbi:nitrilase-related carbon-nitrogen hydrolase [Streptomyces sp. M19]